ncbi:MAG: hypothetical protein PHQ52_05700 [Candidatus Omnitrophica bacterium]|jgi:hypothetical protein|nr:hypothetical protein [Candidatus Omnitrophota bacterium]
MKKIFIILLLFFAILQINSFAEPISKSPTEVQKISAPILDAIVESYNDSNYDRMGVFFSEKMFEEFPQIDFISARKSLIALYGTIQDLAYIGFLTQLNNSIVLYKATCEHSDMLIKVVLSQEGSNYKIVGLWFG